MDSGSYSNVRRGTIPLSSTAPAASSYKANVNRTKTRKWVEAKVQSYDGDDWGNDYDDDYDDGNDPYNEPEPLPPLTTRPTGLPQPGQTGYQLPSSRTFSQPSTATLPSNADSRLFGPSTTRSPSGPPSLHIQTQSTAPVTSSPPYVVESAHPTTISSARQNVPSGPYSAGPASTPSRYPPRKSSMGHQDRPDIDDRMVSKSNSRPGSSSGNRPGVDQRSTSPSEASATTTKIPSFVRPSDIYKRIGEEREKERLSMESGRPSMDSVLGRTEGTASPTQFRSSGEQRRRTSFESHDGSELARARKSSLAPVAERKSEYGMDGLLVRAPTGESSGMSNPSMSTPELSQSQGEPNDEVKADLMKSRRFSTSPQLPTFTRMSGFGDDFFSSTSDNTPKNAANERDVPTTSNRKQPSYALEDPSPHQGLVSTADKKVDGMKETVMETDQQRPSSTHPQLSGGIVSKDTTASAPLQQPIALRGQEESTRRQVDKQDTNVSGMAGGDVEPNNKLLVTEIANLPSSIDTSKNTSNTNEANESKESGTTARHHHDSIGPLATSGHHQTSQTLPPLEIDNSAVQSSLKPASPTAGNESQKTQTSPIVHPTTAAAIISDFTPTAPLNTRGQPGNPDFTLTPTDQRKSTISTIETASPEKESDKLREEIIKSLSPAPISPSPNTDPHPGDLARESTYLAGVYDDYLSLSEEKSLQEVSQAAKKSTAMVPNQSTNTEKKSAPESHDALVSQPAPLGLVQSTVPQSTVPESTTRARRFSWQQDPEDVTTGPIELKPIVSMFPQESSSYDQGGDNTASSNKTGAASPTSYSLQAETGATGTISHQVSQVSSRAPEESLATFEPPSPVSFVATRGPKVASDELNIARLSLADEKEKVLIGDVQSTTSSASEQHPALTKAPEPEPELESEHDGPSSVLFVPHAPPTQPTLAPTPFRDILNLTTYEERVRKFDETREQFYVMDSGLSNWLSHLQDQPEHAGATATSNTYSLLSKPGTSQASTGAPGPPQVPSKSGAAASHPRRTSIGNMQQLMAGQSSSFGVTGNQVGTKSKELLHAAGVFGNKGMKSGMKLFNKGKNKLRR